MIVKQLPSPNYNDRVFPTAMGRKQIGLIILHYTDTPTAVDALHLMQNPGHRAAAHYLVDVDGDVAQLVPDERRAWHAGKSFWAGEEDLNSLSIGIEIQNPGHRGGGVAYTAPQMLALKTLCRALLLKYSLADDAVLGHSDIAPGRKIDPGEWFPWEKLSHDGIGFWPHDAPEPDYVDEDGLRGQLRRCGYNPQIELTVLLTEFQRHFVPEAFFEEGSLGYPTPLTRARLAACARHAANRGGALAL